MRHLVYAAVTVLAVALPTPRAAAKSGLVFGQAIAIAIARDPWLAGSRYSEDALANEAVAAAQLPDPTVAVAALNMPQIPSLSARSR